MIHIDNIDNKMIVFGEAPSQVRFGGEPSEEDVKKQVEMLSKFYKIPMENIMADRNTLKWLFKKEKLDDVEGNWLHHIKREENEFY